ncbi:MAG: nucleotidyltransferase domain-containing protein [Nanoarchaeota archaeon]
MRNKINLFIRKLKEMPDFNKVEFVFLFGSVIEKINNKLSDIDFAIYHSGDSKERFKFRMKMLGNLPDNYDVQIFQDLPLYVRINVLKGKVIYAKDESFVYEKAYETIKAFDDYKKYYYDYLESRRTKYAEKTN